MQWRAGMAQRTLFELTSGSSLATVSIIGSAGRKGDARKMTRALYWRMVAKAEQVIYETFKLEKDRVHLVSGGAAWADHIAVTLFLQEKAAALTLHVPAPWETSEDGVWRFVDNGRPSQSNPGKVANKLHRTFSEKIGEDTLEQIESVCYIGGKLEVHDGFKKRNDKVATSQYLVAFSWSNKEEAPTKGGTLDTWSKCRGRRVHIPLSSLETECEVETHQQCCLQPGLTPMEPQTSTVESQQSSISEELPPSTSPAKMRQSESSCQVESGSGSVDSGIGSLDSCSDQLQHKDIQEQSTRKRHISNDDNSDDSDIECDGMKKTKKRCIPNQCLPQKNKVSEFARQAL